MDRRTPKKAASHYDDNGHGAPPPRRRGCWLGLVVFALISTCGAAIVIALLFVGGQPNAIRIQVDAPKTVQVNDAFTIEIIIENISLNPVTINGVGLETTLLDGVSVVESAPAFRATKDRSVPVYGSWREHTFNRKLLAGEKLAVTFTLHADAVGVYSGDVTVWVESDVLGLPFARARRDTLGIEVR